MEQIDLQVFFEKYGDKIKAKEDVKRLIELSNKNGKFETLSRLAFHAKYSKGLVKIIRDSVFDLEEDYLQKIEKEFLEAIKTVRNLLSEIIEEDKFVQNIFEAKYMQLNRQCLDKLNSLCEDLSYLKIYLNDLKKS